MHVRAQPQPPTRRLRRHVPGLFAVALVVGVWSAAVSAQVEPLGHPTVEQRIEALGISPDDGFRFVVFGDQKSLWREDYPRLLAQVRAETDASGPPLLFMLDTGDIVDDGSKAEQFAELAGHLAVVNNLPYLVGVGNHELKPEKAGATSARARRNTVSFLGPPYASERMFHAMRVGPVRFLFLDTNDLPGVYPDLYEKDPEAARRARAQIDWLSQELDEEVHPTVALSHHAFVQSPSKHRGHARALWNHEHDVLDGRTLAEALIEGGVDLVLTGHVHSYEMFEMARDERTMWSLNVSGKPTGSWFRRPWTRMPSDWRGRETDELREKGFRTRLDQWNVTQLAFMTGETTQNQFALITVDPAGGLHIEVRTVDGTVLATVRIPGGDL